MTDVSVRHVRPWGHLRRHLRDIGFSPRSVLGCSGCHDRLRPWLGFVEQLTRLPNGNHEIRFFHRRCYGS